MFKEKTAAQMAAYLLFKAGADGLSQPKLMALMYLAERKSIRECSMPMASGAFMLTENGPVMKEPYERITGGPEVADRADTEWAQRIEWLPAQEPSAVVGEGSVAYATGAAQSKAASPPPRLALRNPQPRPHWEDMSQAVLEWYGEREEGLPCFEWLSHNIIRILKTVWWRYGDQDDQELIRHMLELPERGGATSGNLPFKTILIALGFTPRETEGIIEFAWSHGLAVTDLDRKNA